MQKIFAKLLVVLVMMAGLTATAREVAKSQPTKGVVRVKLQPETARKIGASPYRKAPGAAFSTGMTQLDKSARSIKAVSIERMLPYAPKFEAEYAKFGLDRWYEIRFDENVDAAEARRVMSLTAGIEKAENIVPMVRQDGGTGKARVLQSPLSAVAESASGFNDPRLPMQWHYQNDGSLSGSVAGADINLFNAWKVTTGSPDVLVAIIDGGIDYNHEDLAQNMAINLVELNGTPGVDDDGNGYVDDVYGYNFVTNSADVYPHNHGTHVAGTVAAVNNNGIGVAGVAGGDGSPSSGIRMFSAQVFDSRAGTSGEGDFAKALIYAANRGASIAQCSWGWTEDGYYEQAVLDAIDYFTEATTGRTSMLGGLCIFAAGNVASTGDIYPGCYPKVLAVAAMTNDLAPASYTNYGEWMDVIAPGGLLDYGETGGVLSTLPDNKYGYMEGTSMACPHVSGIAALILSKYGSPTFPVETLRAQIESSVRDFYSYGNNESWRGLLGTGYVDAERSLMMGDGTAPEVVSDLVAIASQDNITLRWTIPASSDNIVNQHVLYYSTSEFDSSSLSSAKSVAIDTKFFASGDAMEYVLEGLNPETTYYLAMAAVNRQGDASPLSDVLEATTNAGPKMGVDVPSLSFAVTADAPVGSASFNITNEAEGLLRWSAFKRTVSVQASRFSTPRPANVVSYKGKVGGSSKAKAKAPETRYLNPDEYDASDYPKSLAYYTEYWHAIGEMDRTLSNSMAQWFNIDAATYPKGFNLTHIRIQGANGTNPVIQVLKGDGSLTTASVISSFEPSSFYYGGNVALPEQLFFQPGESFWIAVHFAPITDEVVDPYPLGIAYSNAGDVSHYSYMSHDMGKTWSRLDEALKGSPYESVVSEITWSIDPLSLNPDWSEILVLNPVEGTVAKGEQQKVVVSNSSNHLVNGTYNFNLRFNTNETETTDFSVPVTVAVSGNKPEMQVPKIVDFGSLLVGQTKTLAIEVFNKGYGSFSGSQWSPGIYSDKISTSSEHFAGPDYVQSGFPARTKTRFECSYTPKSAGDHTGTVNFTDVEGNTFRVTLRGVATDPAKIAIDPQVIDAGDLDVDADPVAMGFKISNQGRYPLEFVFPRYSTESIDGASSDVHRFGYTIHSNVAGDDTFEYDGNPDLIAAVDITSQFSDVNNYSDEIDLGFDFPYFGRTYNKIYVNNYGGLQFAISENNLFPPLTPTANGVPGTGMICAHGHSLVMGPSSKVVYSRLDGKFIVKFIDVLARVYDKDVTPISFHIALSGNGDVEVHMDSYNPSSLFQGGSNLFVGLCDPSDADPIVYTSADMVNIYSDEQTPEMLRYKDVVSGSAIRFEAPKPNFISAVEPAFGMVNPGEEINVVATLKADASMYAGESFNNLVVMSNDPSNSASFIRFNATITGESLKPELEVVDDIDFGKVFRTADVKVPVTVKNNGQAAMTINAVTMKNSLLTTDIQLPVTVNAGMSKDVILSVPTSVSRDLTDVVTISTSAGDADVTLHGTVIGVPTADLSYTSIVETIESGNNAECPLTITNNGDEPLVYSISPDPMVSFGVDGAAATKVSYTYATSLDDENIKMDWIDILSDEATVHHDITYYAAHDYVEVELPFEFPFYGKKYSKMYIYNTGFVSFTKRNDDNIWPVPPAELPGETVFTNIIAPYWGQHSMDETRTAGTYYRAYDDMMVVSFMEYGNSMNFGVCFQLILNADGSFKFQYTPAAPDSFIFSTYGVAGISSDNGRDGFSISDRYIQFGSAVFFSPVEERTIAPGALETVNISVLGDKMAGEYATTLFVNTNVPSRERIEIPVSLTVNGEAAPVWPDDIAVEHVMGYVETANPGPLGQMGAMYDVEFTVRNAGTAPFTIVNIQNNGPGIEYEDEWLGGTYFEPFFNLFWTTDRTNMMSWSQFYGEPVEVGNNLVYFDVPMMNYEINMTPGEYEVPIVFTYVVAGDDTPREKTVTIKFTVTPPPSMMLDREEVAVVAPTDDYVVEEPIVISNEAGAYKLTYELRLDPTGVGETVEPGIGDDPGIAPTLSKRLAPVSDSLEIARVKGLITPFDVGTSGNYLDLPQDIEFLRGMFYPSIAGGNHYQFGSGSASQAFIGATYFVAPEDGFNISHVYLPVYTAQVENPVVKVEIVKGDNPGGDQILGRGVITLTTATTPYARFVAIPLNHAVFVDSGEDFFVRVTYPVGVDLPAILVAKQDAVKEAIYAAYTEETGWYDAAMTYADQYGSIGYAVSCLETVPGEPWVSLPDGQPLSGVVEVGETAAVKVRFNAAAAPMEKGNRAVLVIKSNDPFMPVVNVPLTLDRNGSPVIGGPESLLFAKEGEITNVTLTLSDPDGDDMQFRFDDPSGIARVKDVTAAEGDTPDISFDQERNLYQVLNAAAPVNVNIEIAPEFGQGDDVYNFTLTAVDRAFHESELTVLYIVEHVNRAPEAVTAEREITIAKGAMSEVVGFKDLFNDPDGDILTYEFDFNGENSPVTAYTTPTGVIFLGERVGNAKAVVTATDPSGATASCTLSLIVSEQSGINDIEADGTAGLVKVMPNPVVGDIHARCAFMAEEATFALYDAAGRQLYVGKKAVTSGSTVVVPLAASPAGIYFLKVTAPGIDTTVTVIKK